MKKTSRREFMIHSAMVLGSTMGGMVLGSRLIAPGPAQAKNIGFAQPSCGTAAQHAKKVLVAYASSCGSTGDVAEAIGKVLCRNGAQVDVRLVKNISAIGEYRAVVVGSAVRASSWLPEALKFVSDHQEALSKVPAAYFLTCLAMVENTPEQKKTALEYFNPALKASPGVQPIDFGCFAGVLDYSKMNIMFRTIMKSRMTKKGVAEGDYRDWPAIEAWAQALGSKMAWAGSGDCVEENQRSSI